MRIATIKLIQNFRAKQERDSDEEGVDIDEDDILVSTLAVQPMQ